MGNSKEYRLQEGKKMKNRWFASVLTFIPLATSATCGSATASQSPVNEDWNPDLGIENFENDELDLILTPAPIIARVEVSPPQFSTSIQQTNDLKPELYLPDVPQDTLMVKKQPVYTSNFNPHQVMPKSGVQLYQQRQASLKAGKLYTRLDPSSFQSSWINASGQPTHEQWKKLLAQEAKVMAQSKGSNRLNILVGDSLTLWLPSQGLSQDKFWLNQGISGENTGHILNRLSAFSQTKADRIYLMAGINDLRNGKSDFEILSNMRNIMKELRQTHPKADLVVQSILPTRLTNISNNRIQQLNYHIQNIAQEEGAHFLNLSNLFSDEMGQLERDYTSDGLHLSPQGYQAWQNALKQTELWLNGYDS
jgi:lysophospholipase L1-like esterase